MKYFLDTEFIEGFYKPLFGKRRHFIDLISIGIIAEDGRSYYAISTDFNPKDADDWVKENVISKLPERGVSFVDSPRRREETLLWKSNEQIAKEIIEFVNPNIQDLIYSYTRHDCWIEEYYKDEFAYIRKHNTVIPKQYWKSGGNGYIKNRDLIYNQPEFYAYFADYDWVVFCSLFGRMIDLPKGFPMYCRDLKQMLDDKINSLMQAGYGMWNDFKSEESSPRPHSFQECLDRFKNSTPYPKQSNEHNALDDAKWNQKLFNFLQTI